MYNGGEQGEGKKRPREKKTEWKIKIRKKLCKCEKEIEASI